MSALGHKQTYAVQNAMSALHPKADMCGATSDVCFGPIADITLSFDHLVGARKHGGRHGEAERFGGLEVDDQFVLGRCLHRHVSRLLALEGAIDVAGRTAILINEISPIGN